MACKNICKLCDRLIISTSVFVDGGNLYIQLPNGSYANGEKYCIVLAQPIPDTATINAPVIIKIGSGPGAYPLNKCNGTQAVACSLRTRTKYSTRVVTTATGGAFQLLGRICCSPNNNRRAIDGTDS